jgi:HK97 family phage prohead protease
LDRLAASFEVKAVDQGQRLIEGYAAAWALDRVGDVIDVKAFDRTLREKAPADVAVFVGHQHDALPVGEALELRPDGHGLLTKTRVLEGPQGDQLLAAARRSLLGLSIGYRVRASQPDKVDGKMVRRLLDVDLIEYSFAAKATIANPAARVTAVKQDIETKPWRVARRGDQWCVEKESDGSRVACHDTEAGAHRQLRALYASEEKTMDVDALPDSAFAYVEPGELDAERKTVPRARRHFPHHDATGALDESLLAIALEDAAASPHAAKALPHLLRHRAGAEDAAEPVWADGAAPALLVAAHMLTRVAEDVADEQRAMARIQIDTKSGRRMRPEVRRALARLIDDLKAIVQAAEFADRDQDGQAAADVLRRRLALAHAQSGV